MPSDRFSVEAFYDANPDALGRSITKWGGFLEDVQGFDASLFEISPREALGMDPQQRILLEVVQDALDDAFLTRQAVQQMNAGVFIGVSASDYGLLQRTRYGGSDTYAGTGSALSIVSNRISHRFNLRGPSFSVDTACSSSLVALDQAVSNLRQGRCDLALVGGVNILADPGAFVAFSKAGMLSPTGRISTFDQRANGYVRGEGAGIVVLRRLSDAKAAGDRIYATLRATSVNQDGRTVTLTSPSEDAQRAMLVELCRRADTPPGRVDYVEAHGTGTPVGDPIEASAIGSVFGQARDGEPVLVGSVKPAIGHLEAAAGISGFIKGVLIAHHRQVPPNANFETPNPAIPFDALNIRVPEALTDIGHADGHAPLVVVNSFGFGGTNASALIEGYAADTARAAPPAQAARPVPLAISAATDSSLRLVAGKLADALEGGELTGRPLADVAAAMGQYRTAFGKRRAVIAKDADEAVTLLREIAASQVPPAVRGKLPKHVAASPHGRPKIAFTFAGQGAQWWGMARRLIQEDQAFGAVFNAFDEIFSDLSGWSIKAELLRDKADSKVGRGIVAQPGIFGVQIGLAAYWASRGVTPDLVIGHSFGEIAAAHVAGALDLEAATRLISTRSRVQERIPAGTMMVVGMAPAAFTALAGDRGVDIAAFNGPQSIAVSGPVEAIEETEKFLAGAAPEVMVRRLQTDCAWHSHLIGGVEGWFRETLASIAYQPPTVPLVSTVTGTLQTVFDLEYWWRNLRQPVRYDAAIATALGLGSDFFLELSPHRVLSGLTAGIAADRGAKAVIGNSLIRDEDDFDVLAVAAAELYCAGASLDWPAVTGGTAFKGGLPSYGWDRQEFWHQSEEARETLYNGKVHPLLGARRPGPDLVWTNEFSLISERYLGGHAVEGDTIFPAAGYLEIMLAAGRDALEDGVIELTDVEFLAALFVRPDDTIVMNTRYDPRSGLVEIFSRTRDESPNWVARARGHMRISDAMQVSEVGGADEAILTLNRSAFYEETSRHGLDYKDAFQSVGTVDAGPESALGTIDAAPEMARQVTAYLAHPALLDSALQTVVAIGRAANGNPNELSLPVGVKRLRFAAQLPLQFTVASRMHNGRSARERSADYLLRNMAGAPLIAIDGMELRSVDRNVEAAADNAVAAQHFLESFVETSLARAEGDALTGSEWLMVADVAPEADQLIAALAAHGANVRLVPVERALDFAAGQLEDECRGWIDADGRRGIIFAAPYLLRELDESSTGSDVADAVERMTSALTGIGRTLLALKDENCLPELLVLTREARLGALAKVPGVNGLAGSSTIGLARTIANECSSNRVVSIDCPAELNASLLVGAIADARGETEWVLSDGTASVPRLRALDAADLPRALVTLDPKRDGKNFALTMSAPGSPNNLLLKQAGTPDLEPGQVLVRTRAVGLNFRDVMAVTGLLPADAEPDPAWENLGLEYSAEIVALGDGVVGLEPGDRVMGMGRRCLQAFQTVEAATLTRLSGSISDAEAATIPSAFSTAYYALNHVARLRKGERVLIHLGTGGVGLAAIQIARNIGAEIFATAGSDAKRNYLRELGVAHVMHSRSLSFADDVLAATRGEGVDVVLNALPTAYIEKGVQLLRPFGRFLEIGKRDVYADTPIGMHGLRKNISFNVIDLAAMASDRPDLLAQVMDEVNAEFAAGKLAPLPLQLFDITEARDAFRHMSQAKHIGKVVIGFSDEPVSVVGTADTVFAARADGNYLVTGGSRGFGLSVAEWLSVNGAGEVTLASRSGVVDAGAEALLEAARARGTIINSCALDVTDAAAVDALVAELSTGARPLAGIVHGAAVIDDAFIGQLDRGRIAAVVNPKVAGAWNLHGALQRTDAEVDFFVSFSSIAQVIGSIGQANYVAANAFLDGFAFYRKASGRTALTIDWGALGEAGFVARNESLGRYLDSMGMVPLQDAEAFEGLASSLGSDLASVAYARIDWSRLGRALGQSGQSPRLSTVMSGRREGTHQIRADLAVAPQSDWPEIVSAFVIDEVTAVLGVDKAEVTASRALTELGFDSLSSIELKNRLESRLSLSFTVGVFLQAKTLGDLALLVVDLLVQEAKAKQARADNADGGDGEEAVTSANGAFVASDAQLRALKLATGSMTSGEGRLALESAALLPLDSACELATLEAAWTQLCERHPVLRLARNEGALELGEQPALVAVSAAHDAIAGALRLEAGELVRAVVQTGDDGATHIALRAQACVTDRTGLDFALAEWAALADGSVPAGPEAGEVLDRLRMRHVDLDRDDSIADIAYWRAMLRPFIPAAKIESRRIALAPLGLGLNRGPSAVLQLDLPEADRESDEATLLAALAIALARRTKSASVLVERHFEQALAGSVGPWADSMPIILRDAGSSPSVARDRIRRQLANGERHVAFGLASCDTHFADEMKAAGTLAGQFGFTWHRPLGSRANAHDLCLEVTPADEGVSLRLVFDTLAIDEVSARALLADIATLAGEITDRVPEIVPVERVTLRTDRAAITAAPVVGDNRVVARDAKVEGVAAPALQGTSTRSVTYPALPSTHVVMSVLRGQHTTRTFLSNWNVNQALLVRPGIDARRMAAALERLVARHDTLRTHYRFVGERLLAVVDDEYRGKLHVQDLGDPTRAEMLEMVSTISSQSFDMDNGPLFEVHLLKCGRMGDVVLIHLCEFISDGWSTSLIVDELVRHYFGLGVAGDGTRYAELLKLTALPEDGREARDAYWRSVLASPVPLPTFGRIAKGQLAAVPGMQAPYQRRTLQINKAGASRLRKRSKALGVNENALWSAAIMGPVTRMAGVDSAYLAMIHAMRNNGALHDKVAMLSGRLPVRCDVAEAGGFDALAQQIQERATLNNEHAFPGLAFDAPLQMQDGSPSGQSAWTQWAYGRVLPEQVVKNSLAGPLLGSAAGGTTRILTFEIEALPAQPYGFSRGDFALRPMTNKDGIEIHFYHDLLSLTPAEAEQLLDQAIGELGLDNAHFSGGMVSEMVGHMDDIARLNKGLAPEIQSYASRIG
ncbi:MAG: SDR family NAD(P)-dependent oxidoreductase [Hyphomicrobiales bacterium]|nr:MAG: SDR family NAD(P)-dependent oxidoreductase [Hyphomicrobiales bacterium]